MPHQCVHCGKLISSGSKEILEGCASCTGRFFFYIRDDKAKKIKEEFSVEKITQSEKKQIEKEIRQILKIEKETEPVVLDLESVRVISPGKFEIDLVSLLNRKPIIFKLQEGKYLIDLDSALPNRSI